MKTKGTYQISGSKQNPYELEINYTYYWDYGTYDQPAEAELEIDSVELNGQDITNFYFDFLDVNLYEEVMYYAEENKH